jgi:preprotein translocase subunit SecB
MREDIDSVENSQDPPPEAAPLYGLQLREVYLWQLSVERGDVPRDFEPSGPPSVDWDLQISPPDPEANDEESDGGALSAKLNLRYVFPATEPVAYRIHIEMVGVFFSLDAPAESSTDDNNESVQNAGSEDSSSISEDPPYMYELNPYTVTTLLWPYMRELVHQVQLRMRVPLFLLPTLNVAMLLQDRPPSEDAARAVDEGEAR